MCHTKELEDSETVLRNSKEVEITIVTLNLGFPSYEIFFGISTYRNLKARHFFQIENDVFQTTDGKLIPERQNVNLDYKARSLECVNELNDRRSKPRTPRYWYPRKIKCEDYKVQ